MRRLPSAALDRLQWGSGASTFIVGPMAKRAWSVDNHKARDCYLFWLL